MPDINTSVVSGISYRKMGSGPAVVLLHGFPESGSLWRYIWGSMAEVCTLIIPDLPGSGSSPLMAMTGTGDMAQQVKDILDAEKIDKAIIAGHSMGGYVAFAFAQFFPGRVAGLSLVHSTPAADDEDKKATRKKVIDIVQKGGREAFIRQMVPGLFSDDFKQKEPELVKEQVTNALDMGADSIVNFYTAMMERPDSSGMLDKVPFPIQWICGEDDTVIPFSKIVPYSYRAGVNFVTCYKLCGHMSMVEAPGQLVTDLKQFIRYCS